ncbi:MAG: Type-2 restriction enzyme TaqI [Candidatus Azambacteria bacterium GW2011_GWB2_46_37]|uniref:Type-2 restriction enzyme TaqI n=1 Tax=Candidatus Azambacteria bacterium GW2011_GWB2_46_37 TaxID=1618618 RepID=A0A0G1Q0F7_9BACT|nr:MAG: Type-2 restriction enzyme TaqI [Candidatus Azambacteria bacterium GW2011_GWB2_46_37]
MLVQKFDNFLQSVDLKSYRDMYRPIKIVEMDLPKEVQAINMLYKVYWDKKKFLSFEDFYKEYLSSQKTEIESFRQKITMCKDCFYRGLPARIYRTWASIITQIHAGYVAESVFGEGTVAMSGELDHQGADFQVRYKGKILNYQVKKKSFSGEVRRGKGGVKNDYFENPKKKDGEYKLPYKRFQENKELKRFQNGFVVFAPYAFEQKKKEIDEALK